MGVLSEIGGIAPAVVADQLVSQRLADGDGLERVAVEESSVLEFGDIGHVERSDATVGERLTADGGDRVALLQAVAHLLIGLFPLVFRPDQHEIEDGQHQEKHQNGFRHRNSSFVI